MTTRSAPSQAAVLGHPIDHSLSPVLHQAAYRALGIAIEYTRADVDLDQVKTFYRDRRHELTTGHTRWLGFSVTMPLKPALVPLMDQLSDRVRRLGVLNTVVLDASGQATGYNTDCDGIVRALMRAETPASSTLGIIGGGGTAAAAIEAAQLMGVTGVELLVRNQAKTEPQRKLATDLGLAAEIDSIASGLTKLDRYRYVISTLPPGAASEFAHSLSGYTWLPPLLDVAYDPWPSQLALVWHRNGGQVISGMEMLLYQAVEQVKLLTAELRAEHEARQATRSHQAEPDWDAVTVAMAEAIGLTPRPPKDSRVI
ncbi:shikimate dehydrogenase family protein [Auritidibacter ignavus]|uniref:shikimate dehydrogenase family protein n=1 Tax=Auritidibacter ignavus TaxID=678932 RepID=UPI0024472A84|nr:shikimate dehydrogenase [Auritidibacter ignavus]WGH84511.1 shikimate dehydrogenase [Auritidibacter ignavus]